MASNLPFFIREVSQSLRRNILINVASTATVLILIFILGFFISFISNVNHIVNFARAELHIKVVLPDSLNLKQVGNLKHRILKDPDVESASFVSREQAFRKLKNQLKNEVDLQAYTRNPLPQTIEVKLKDTARTVEVAERMKKYNGVSEVRYGDIKIIDSFIRLSRFVFFGGLILILFLLVSAIFLIGNTIRLTVHSRRKEIAIMELVGADTWFIRGPFLIEGLIHGILGSGLAILFLNYFYMWAVGWMKNYMRFMPIKPPAEVLPELSIFLLLTGIIIGGLSSYISVNKYLRISG